MKISRLYLKFFLAFMLVLILSELILFWFMTLSWSQSPRVSHMERQLITVKNLAEMNMEQTDPAAETRHSDLTTLLQTLGRSIQADIWITGPYGELVASSTETIPDMHDWTSGEAVKSMEGAYIYKKKVAGLKSVYGLYTSSKPRGYPYTYHVFHSIPKFNEDVWFMRSQIVLIVLAALFLIPVSRRMISPVKELTVSASRMGRGDLKQRVRIKGRDEIAELGTAFNHMAEELEKMVKSSRELTANVSHELRSPLARMRISLEMLKEKIEENGSPGCEGFINGMQFEISHMDELIGKIIKFSKLDIHKLPAMNETADLKAIIEDLISQYSHIATRNRISIELHLEDVKTGNCNRNALTVVLDNILGNAFKYTDPDGDVSISLKEEDNTAHIEVANTHPPLTEEDLEEIFNPFHRLKGQELPGSGLGLAAARKITGIHGGSIRAANSSKGFTIIVEIPT
ncbi:HAMP domain-containing sensor histidine kinase [Maridesulfovibrio sp.]|uniref:sensor histidine kinase n=1 Tax=Maridesulfovibrio sp. TaxID=2795000 RepID=UPI002A189705|nr:HAMP domain-containing sensor histidine kinase [Maridesulfovibrio sp.]